MTTPTLREQGFMAYPEGFKRFLFRLPILGWRAGFGPLLGTYMLMMSIQGRKSGLVRYTPIEYHVDRATGRIYILSGWGEKAQWYKNLMAYPYLTIQTGMKTLRVKARRVTDATEFHTAYQLFRAENPVMAQWYLQALQVPDTWEAVAANRERMHFLTFDPTSEPTPEPLKADLVWLWGVIGAVIVLGWLLMRNQTKP